MAAPTEDATIPLVDYTLAHDEMARQVQVAMRDFGFMFLANHGLSEAIAELRAASMSFFHLPEDDERKTRAAGVEGQVRGYYRNKTFNTYKALGKDGPPDYCAQFFMGDEGTGNRFPTDEYEAVVTKVYDGFTAIGRKLTQAVLDVYGLPPTWVEDEFKPPTLTSFKVLHYPAPPVEECKGLRMAPHFDIDALTILYQDPGVPGGLQVNFHGEWQDVNAPPDTLVINVGEVLKFLSGGVVRCTEHRVVMPRPEDRERSERMSMALFLTPGPATILTPCANDSQLKVDGVDEGQSVSTADWFQSALAKFRADK